MTTTHTC